MEYTERETQRKRESKRQTSEDQREKERQRARRREKSKGDIFLLEEQHEIFVAAVRKWEKLSGHQGAAVKKKGCKNTYDISSTKRVTRKFLEVSRCSRATQRQRNVQKKCQCTCKVAFLLITPIVVFSPFSLLSPLSITRFYILFEQNVKIIESFTFSPG